MENDFIDKDLLLSIQEKCFKTHTHLGTVNLGTGEDVTDICLFIHAMNVIAKNIPLDNYFICNVCPFCILQKEIHCKECDVD